METRYWLRHASLRGILGPYDLASLRATIDAGSFPADSEVLAEGGLSRGAAEQASGWIPVADALGRPRPATTKPAQPGPRPTRGPQPVEHLATVRAATAYPMLRALIQVGMVVGVLATMLTTLVALTTVRADGSVALMALAGAAFQLLAILVVAWMLQAVLDIADCALRRDR